MTISTSHELHARGDHAVVLLGRLLGLGDAEHLDLLELVNPEDAAHVLAVRAGLLAEARGEAGLPDRQLGRLQPLLVLHSRQRLFGRGHHQHRQVVVGHFPAGFLGVGALAFDFLEGLVVVSQLGDHAHQVLLHEVGALDRQEAFVGQECDAVVVERNVDAHQWAGQEVSAVPGHLPASFQVNSVDECHQIPMLKCARFGVAFH